MPYPACVKYEGDEIKEIRITSTLIKSLLHKGEPKHICPRKLYATYLTGLYQSIPTESMMDGLYFESHCLGSGRSGKVFDLPRLKGGGKTVDQKRIDEQIKMFPLICKMYGIEIFKEGSLCNTQVEAVRPIKIDNFKDIEINLVAGLDIVSPIRVKQSGFDYDAAVIDLKLTRDRDNQHGAFSWGLPQYMDHTQGVLYSTATGLPFFYLVMDYKGKDRGHKLLPVATMAMFPEGETTSNSPYYNLAKQRLIDLRLAIRQTIEIIVRIDHEQYPEIPSYDECQLCPLSPLRGGSCEFANAVKQI